jgi:hypothetical protein
MYRSPYACSNPVSQCLREPGLTKLNQELGCLELDSATSCIPARCPNVLCGNRCPTACPADMTDAECEVYEKGNAGDSVSDCTLYNVDRLLRYMKRTALPGCTGACTGSDATSCCSDITYAGKNTKDPFSISGATQGAPLAYQNFLNVFHACMMSSCSCPTTTDTACSGHGKCEQAAVGSSRWFCACDVGYSGDACQDGSVNARCPRGWDADSKSLVECGGPSHGKCNTATNVCACSSGWGGAGCDRIVCPNVQGELCGGNGTCNYVTGQCVCSQGFSGVACNCHNGKCDALVSSGPGEAHVETPSDLAQDAVAARNASGKRMRIAIIVVGVVIAVVIVIVASVKKSVKIGGVASASVSPTSDMSSAMSGNM